ncbi:MAG TPA: hypothetical protein VHT96_18525 [Clostridia bacterium]|nr:hypothetical protein [Clostridia bacterium]
MAIYNIDTDKLRTDAEDLNKCKADLFQTLGEIGVEVERIPGVWEDEVAKEFMRKFKGLSDDFKNYDSILGDYVKKALEIADEYDKANAEANSELGDLLTDI